MLWNLFGSQKGPELFKTFGVTSASIVIPRHHTTEITLQNVFESQSDHLREEDKSTNQPTN